MPVENGLAASCRQGENRFRSDDGDPDSLQMHKRISVLLCHPAEAELGRARNLIFEGIG